MPIPSHAQDLADATWRVRAFIEIFDVHQEVETKLSHNFRFRSYGGKTFPEWPKLVEGAQIAQELF